MAAPIEFVPVAEDRLTALWGRSFGDYRLEGKLIDFQDIAVNLSQARALRVEDELIPLRDIIMRRNERLEKYGQVLSKLTELQTLYAGDSPVTAIDIGSMDEADFAAIMDEFGYSGTVVDHKLTLGKSQTDGAVQMAKSKIDALNNEAQKDINRMQALVDRRDESFSTATELMKNISSTRDAVIRNL